MISFNIPINFVNVVFQYLNNKRIYVKDQDGKLHGPKNISGGLLQGSPISPLLFNMYTSDIHRIFKNNDNIEIIQYADDIALISSNTTTATLIADLNEALKKINEWCKSHNFQISTEKTTAVLFRKGKPKNTYDNLKLGNSDISWKNEVRYLGVNLTYNLNWNSHINNRITKASKGLNILRALCGTEWGADPTTLLMVYKNLIRSHLDFGGQYFNNASKNSLKKLDQTQFEALRQITGCMKSTPTNVLLAECGEMSLEFRRKWLTTKLVNKFRYHEPHPINTNLKELRNHCSSRQGYWRNRKKPLMVQCLEDIEDHAQNLPSVLVPPIYSTQLKYQITKFPTHMTPIGKNEHYNNAIFSNYYNEKFSEYTWIFTDGSMDPVTNKTGIGVTIPSLNINFSARLHDFTQICNAEIIAIHKAILTCLENDIPKAIIFTDSKSAIEKLNSTKLGKSNIITINTKEILFEALSSDYKIVLTWIPGHTGILGNSRADELAKKGKDLDIPLNLELGPDDILPILKRKIQDHFQNDWQSSFNFKGKQYKNIQDKWNAIPWFRKIPYKDRRHITTLIRIRTNHTLSKEHLFKIGIENSPLCECGQIESLTHILLECPINITQNVDLYKSLILAKIPTPISIYSILTNLNISVIKKIIQFLDINRIKI